MIGKLPKTRSEAKNKNVKFYFTGNYCKNGHLSKRQTSNGCCYQCSLMKNKEYLEKNKENRKKYREKNREKIKEYSVSYYIKNKKKRREYLIKNKKKISEYSSSYVIKNKEKIRKYKSDYYKLNKNKFFEYSKKRYGKVRNDKLFKISKVMREMVRRSLNKQKKRGKTIEYLGYSAKDLCSHLESKFLDGMNWNNYGDWHIDHIVPISFFMKKGIFDPTVINSLSNLQPLWACDNLKKGGKI